MVTGDVEVLRELLGSVYLTARQKQALGRLLGGRLPFVGDVTKRADRMRNAVELYQGRALGNDVEEDVVEEDRRHALLGPCGAE